VLARGRDPFFPAWPDVFQLNAFDPGLRSAAIETVQQIAEQCDGVRCDMAMLMINDIFERTWGARAGARPAEEYWITLIGAVRARHPEFRFLAEAYWDQEWALQQQGFNNCYDKTLYDRMEHGEPERVRQHLLADMAYQLGMVRFLENHDEPRAATTFPGGKGRAAAVAVMTLPGTKLLHEGQFEGRRVRLPVFLGRRPEEPADEHLAAFYRRLLAATAGEIFRNGQWRLCERTGWPDNPSYLNILAWCWEHGDDRRLIVVNFSAGSSQAMIKAPWDDMRGKSFRLSDSLSGETFERSGDDLVGPGMFVSLAPWQSHFLHLEAGALSTRELGVER
jgi:hypothetical protein